MEVFGPNLTKVVASPANDAFFARVFFRMHDEEFKYYKLHNAVRGFRVTMVLTFLGRPWFPTTLYETKIPQCPMRWTHT